MTPKFNYVVCSLEESKNLDVMTIDELPSSLLVHEQRMKSLIVEEQALKVATRESSRRRGRGRSRTCDRGRSENKISFDKSTIEYYHCHKLGHFQYACPSKGSNEKANYAEGNEEMLLMAYFDDKEVKTEECWFLCLGCSKHVCGKREFFSEIDESFREKMKLGDNFSMNVMGKRTVRILVNGFIHIITGVFYVPGLKNNLLSISQQAEKGLVILIKNGLCKIYHPEKGLIIELAMSTNRIFKLFGVINQRKETCFNSFMDDLARLCHYQYGHLSFSGLNLLQRKGMVKGLPHFDTSLKICEDCLVGKQQRLHFPRESTWRAS